MHLKAITTIIHNGVTYKPGATVPDVSDADAKVLIAGGHAVEADEAPAESDQASVKHAKPAKAEKAAAAGGEGDGN